MLLLTGTQSCIVPSVTIPGAAGVVEGISATRSRLALPAALPYHRASGLFFAAVLIVAYVILGHPTLLDPAVLVPVAALAGAAVGGIASGVLGVAVGEAYLVLYYSQPGVAAANGGMGRVIASIAASAIILWLAAYLADRGRAERAVASAAARRSTFVSELAARLADESQDEVPTALVRGAASLLRADMAVLTLLDPHSGRHIVRVAFGGGSSAVGVEVTPGMGVTGRAIRDRAVVTGSIDATSASGLNRRLRGNAGAQSMAAVASIQSGRVVASLTVGRTDGLPFSDEDQRLLEGIGSMVALALAGSLVRSDVEYSAARDRLTGLYTRAYMEAALDQQLALRRRTPAEERKPLAMLLLDMDQLNATNRDFGADVGDMCLHSVATLVQQRFRNSDLVARVGVDEFVIVLNGATAEIAGEVASQIRRQVAEMALTDEHGQRIPVSVSTGCGIYCDGDKAHDMIASARAALDAQRRSNPVRAVSN